MYSRVILSFNQRFGCELLVLHANLSMFHKFLVHVSEGLGGQTHFGMPKSAKISVAPNEPNRMFFIQNSTPTPSMYKKLTKHGKFCMQSNQLPTKSLVEL
jgi:hypothetical protein